MKQEEQSVQMDEDEDDVVDDEDEDELLRFAAALASLL